MNDLSEQVPTLFRIQCVSGDLAGAWLWTFRVGKRGVNYKVHDWAEVEQHQLLYTFYPNFLADESAAMKIPTLDEAQVMQRLIKRLGIETEIKPVYEYA
jgi:hypothetical protein